jgi:uncharacterized membrane protein
MVPPEGGFGPAAGPEAPPAETGLTRPPSPSYGTSLHSRLARRFATVARWAWQDKGFLLVLGAVVVYSYYWSSLTIARFYALDASVFDLGIQTESMWVFLHPAAVGLSTSQYAYLALAYPNYFLLSPITLPGSYPLLLVVQSVALGSAALPIYLVALHELRTRLPSLLLSLAYLLYFPLAGPNWFDFHTAVFFVPLFLFGYALYLHGWSKCAYALFLLAGLSYYPYELFIILFSALLLAERLVPRMRRSATHDTAGWRFALALLVPSAVFFAIHDLYTVQAGYGFLWSIHTAAGPAPLDSVPGQVLVLVLALSPVLFLPFFSVRWLAMLTPFLFLVLTGSGFPGYTYPDIFRTQYPVMFIPFVFLGTIEALSLLSRRAGARAPMSEDPSAPREARSSRFDRVRRRAYRVQLRVALCILVLTIVLGAIGEPYGPYNVLGGEGIGAEADTHVNWTEYDALTALVHLIPSNDPYVLMQANMPEALPRPVAHPLLVLDFPYDDVLTPGVSWLDPTPSEYDITHNSFPMTAPNGTTLTTRIDYAIVNPFGAPGNGPSSFGAMAPFASLLYSSGSYGILGEDAGLFVLAYGYSGPPRLYAPLALTIGASELYSAVGTTGQSTVSATDVNEGGVWHGPYIGLSPGRYMLTYRLSTTNDSPDNRVTLGVTADAGETTVVEGLLLTGTNFTADNSWTEIARTIYVTEPFTLVEFPATNATWSGTISISSISLDQVAPAHPTGA